MAVKKGNEVQSQANSQIYRRNIVSWTSHWKGMLYDAYDTWVCEVDLQHW